MGWGQRGMGRKDKRKHSRELVGKNRINREKETDERRDSGGRRCQYMEGNKST